MVIQILKISCYISIFQIVLICFYLFFKKGNHLQNRKLLIALLLVWAVFISGSFILISSKKSILLYDVGHLLNLAIFLVAPVLYLYFKSLFSPDFRLSLKDLLHAIPFAVVFFVLVYEILLRGTVKYVFYPESVFVISLLLLQNICYSFLIMRQLGTLQGEDVDKSKVKLYRYFLGSAATLFAFKLLIFVSWNVFLNVEVCVFITGIFFLVAFIIINSLVLFSLNNPSLLIGAFRYQNSGMSREELEENLRKITALFANRQVFTDPLISLERLSANLQISDRAVSQTINRMCGLNFNDFVNKYRIEYAMELIREDESRKILDIAYETGFNSKTTFNSSFKKITGQTPSAYKKSLLRTAAV